jgi:hypothetical protein
MLSAGWGFFWQSKTRFKNDVIATEPLQGGELMNEVNKLR